MESNVHVVYNAHYHHHHHHHHLIYHQRLLSTEMQQKHSTHMHTRKTELLKYILKYYYLMHSYTK